MQPQQSVTITILRNGTEINVNAKAPGANQNTNSTSINQQLVEMRSQIKTLQAEVKTLKSNVQKYLALLNCDMQNNYRISRALLTSKTFLGRRS